MKRSQTSDRISSIAARYTKVTVDDLALMSAHRRQEFVADVRSMAASLLRQDETKGLRGLLRRALGR